MTDPVVDIKNAVAALPERDQADPAVWLLDSLADSGFRGEAEHDNGLDEAVRRREELDSDRVAPASEEELWADVARARSAWTILNIDCRDEKG